MGFDGSGNYTRTNGTQTGSTLWQDRAAIAPATISAAEHDAEMNDVANALTACIKADGSKTATNNQPMGGFKHTGVADATLANQYATLGQVQTGLTVNDLVVNANSTTTAFRVTQTGSGEALRVEDSANPDSTPFVIDASGNVGIGASSPALLLHLKSAAPAIRFEDTDAGATIYSEIGNNSTAGLLLLNADPNNAAAGSEIRFNVDNATRLLLTSDNKIGFGTASPNKKFTFDGPTDDGVQINASNRPQLYFSASGTIRATLSYDTTTNQTGVANSFFVQNGTQGLYLQQGGTTWTAVSDARAKKNITSIDYGLAEIKALHPVRYDMLTDESNDARRLGFIAQELQPIVPEMVSGSTETQFGVTVTDLIPILTKAVQELAAKVETLEAEIATLKGG